MTTKLNLNVSPYYDDFDEFKNFHQILFKPGYAVQARELTQLQTILKNQIEKFGNNIFKHGSVVIPGNSFADLQVPYVKLNPTYSAQNIDVSLFENKVIIGETSGVKAKVRKAVAAEGSDPNTFYLVYLSGGVIDNVQTGKTVFDASENVYLEDNPAIKATVVSSAHSGFGSMAFVNAGVYYVNGTFVQVASQSAVIAKYSTTPSCHVVLEVKEEIKKQSEDETLLDPAQGSYNYAAPGADRLKIYLQLTFVALESTLPENLIEIMRYNQGVLELHARTPKYSELEKALAARTYDESGDYVVSGFDIAVEEYAADDDKLAVTVSPGRAYIRGFAAEQLAKSTILIDKARTASHVKETAVNMQPKFGQYFYISNLSGVFDIGNHETVTLWNDNDHTNGSATQLGTAKVYGLDFLIGDPVAGTAIYKLWVHSVNLNSGITADQIGGVRYNSGANRAFVCSKMKININTGLNFTASELINFGSTRTATVKYWNPQSLEAYIYRHDHVKFVPNNGDVIVGATSTASGTVANKTTLVSEGQSSLLFSLPKNSCKSLKNSQNAYALSYTVQKELSLSTDGSGNGTTSVAGGVVQAISVDNFIAIGSTGVLLNSLFSLDVSGTIITCAGGPVSSTVKIYCTVTKTTIAPRAKSKTTTSQTFPTAIGDIQLSKCDIIRVVQVIDTVGDITANYNLDTGQRDYAYERGSLKLKAGKLSASGSTTVTYEYYDHGATGDFFSIDSYSSDATLRDRRNVYISATNSVVYDLLSCIDFRPRVGDNGLLSGANSRKNDIIISEATFSTALQYYVGRTDVVTIDASGTLRVVPGIPAEVPYAPAVPAGQFAMNILNIPAYTRIAEGVGNTRLDVERFTMRDIKGIQQRVERLENYVTLTQAEQVTSATEIIDAATGLNRFKTGYLVENFQDPFKLGRTTSSEFKATFAGNRVGPQVESLKFRLKPDTLTNVVQKKNGIFVSYTETPLIKQPLSSRVTNLNPFLVVAWSAMASVSPREDVWVEMNDLPTVFETETEYIDVQVPIPCPPPPPAQPPVVTTPPAVVTPTPSLWNETTTNANTPTKSATTWDTWEGLQDHYVQSTGKLDAGFWTDDSLARSIQAAANLEFSSNGTATTIFDTPAMTAVVSNFASTGQNVIYSSGGVQVTMVTAADGSRQAVLSYDK